MRGEGRSGQAPRLVIGVCGGMQKGAEECSKHVCECGSTGFCVFHFDV